jgi:hypothetical protein
MMTDVSLAVGMEKSPRVTESSSSAYTAGARALSASGCGVGGVGDLMVLMFGARSSSH